MRTLHTCPEQFRKCGRLTCVVHARSNGTLRHSLRQRQPRDSGVDRRLLAIAMGAAVYCWHWQPARCMCTCHSSLACSGLCLVCPATTTACTSRHDISIFRECSVEFRLKRESQQKAAPDSALATNSVYTAGKYRLLYAGDIAGSTPATAAPVPYALCLGERLTVSLDALSLVVQQFSICTVHSSRAEIGSNNNGMHSAVSHPTSASARGEACRTAGADHQVS